MNEYFINLFGSNKLPNEDINEGHLLLKLQNAITAIKAIQTEAIIKGYIRNNTEMSGFSHYVGKNTPIYYVIFENVITDEEKPFNTSNVILSVTYPYLNSVDESILTF